MVHVAVLGAGVVGLSTAVNIQHLRPKVRVTLVAERFYDATTSYGSGGIFVPSVPPTDTQNAHRYKKWCDDSGKFYRKLATGPEACESGAMMATGYNLTNADLEKDSNPLYKDIIFSHRKLSDEEMKRHGFHENFRIGYEDTTFILDQTKYLKWLQNRFEANGGSIQRRKVLHLSEMVDSGYDVVVNCCGLGSREVFDDKNMHAVRGQLVRVRAPWINHWFYSDNSAYIIPRGDTVTLGGTKQAGNEAMAIDDSDRTGILDRCARLCPMIKGAEIDHEWVGLRPAREPGIRLESERILVNGRILQVVHNYGHGSNGVAFSWGTAIEAAQLVARHIGTETSHL